MRRKWLVVFLVSSAVYTCFGLVQANAASATLILQYAGATPFISFVAATVSPAASLTSVQFTIAPKPGSVTRPVSATYQSDYLVDHGYLNNQTGAVTIPIFGLYAGRANTVTLKFTFTDNTVQQSIAFIIPPAWSDPCNEFNTPTVVQARTNSTNLSYDFFLVKDDCGTESPVIMDSDGAVRWVGTAGFTSHASALYDNGIYISAPPANSSSHTGLARMEFDGTYTFLRDYSNMGVTDTGHHNYDPGRNGLVLEVSTTSQTESVLIEVDALGAPIRSWNFGDIISNAMTAGGDDPTQFVAPAPNDWFHNNSSTYHASDNSLVVSSRENFVIAVDYDTAAIKWILGDPTKQWYEFPSLRAFALTLGSNTLPPIGQHAVSYTKDGNFLLFDDGQNSFWHTPAGTDRQASFPRKYSLDLSNDIATEVWNYSNGNSVFSWICSSIYEDAALNYLIDYADIVFEPGAEYSELVGLEASGAKVFDYRYTTVSCSTDWNVIPVHLEAMNFATVQPVSAVSRKVQGSAGTFDVPLPLTGNPGIECRSGGAAGAYEVVLTFASPVTVTSASVTEAAAGNAQVSGSPVVNGNQVTIDLTGVKTSDSLMITLDGVSDGANVSKVMVPMLILVGDVTGDGEVTNADLNLVKGKNKRVTTASFRRDVTADGRIDNADAHLIKANLTRSGRKNR